MALDFFAGCLGGCAGVLVGHPFDTVKVRLQTQDFRNPLYRGALDCFAKTLKKESVSGLYKGMSSPMAGVAVVNAIVFGVYGNFQRNLPNPEALSSHFYAGAAAGFVQSFVCSPMELVKTRLQVQKNNMYSGPLNCLVQVFRSDGLRGVFRGLGTTILREIPGVGTYFYAYELMTRTSDQNSKPISTPHMLLAGGLSGSISWIITYPIDVVKSRLQADGAHKYTGFIDCLKKSIQTEGYGVLVRGLNSTILRAFPTNAATFTVVTWVIRWGSQEQVDDTEGYIVPDIVNRPFHEIQTSEDTGFGIKMYGLKGAFESENGYLNKVYNWRNVVLHEISGSSAISSLQFLPKSSQVYSVAKDVEESTGMPEVEVNLDKTADVMENETETEGKTESDDGKEPEDKTKLAEETQILEKSPNTYEHKNDYYNSSVR